MRMTRALAIGAGMVALAATAGCGDSDSAGSGLPEAKDVASIASYVSKYTSCTGVMSGDNYDSAHVGENESWGTEEAKDPSWGIKERAVCKDASGAAITLLITPDMRKFQSAVKKSNEKLLIGQDFAVIPVGQDAIRDLTKSHLKFLTCDPDFSVPSGYTKHSALVNGCVLTNYVPE
ncbi:hypothetical protein AB0L75_05115 [Streptomyces sp. NPDC052101]|uniref:hypothetical protein n=1 Tax=Streptomyces sp. NPDC052101 TaxID=3155763 RepID=UPI00343E56F5